ncbi:MAG: polysaccharide deacetylase family protein [Hyphomicrobiaceae bacterium]
MRQIPVGLLVAGLAVCAAGQGGVLREAAAGEACKPSESVLGVSRTIEIDTRGGPKYGSVNYAGNEILKDREVLLTFDDGPLPKYTNKVLKALEKECTRATFFAVGRMSIVFPKTIRRILKEGHTLGTHTWSHANLGRWGSRNAIAQYERGMAAIEAAAGTKISPIFRFPYLARSRAMEAHLAKRDIAIFSIDVDSRDTRRYGSSRIISHTMRRLKARGKGIVLFHDIKRSTAHAIPRFLKQLRKNGFKIVHLKTKNTVAPLASFKTRYDKLIAAREAKNRKKKIKIAQKALGALPTRNSRSRAQSGFIRENSAVVPPANHTHDAHAHDAHALSEQR